MNGKDFALLVESIQEGGKILTKEKKPARTSIFSPPDIRNIRKNAKATQIEFASMIGISFARLRNWEQGRRTPEGPALALLKVASEDPQYIKKILNR
jgi:putative transcriptional regulator